MQHGQLHVLGHTGGKALDVHLLRIQSAGLNEELVPLFLREADDFRLNAGAVPGADAGDGAVVNGAPGQIGPDDLVGFFAGVGQVAHGGVIDLAVRPEGEGLHGFVPRLQLHFGKINAAPVHPGGRTRLEPPQGKPKLLQTVGQADAGVHSVRPRGDDAFADDDGGIQIGSRGDDHGLCSILRPQVGAHPGHGPILRENFRDLGLLELQIFLHFQGVLHIFLVAPPVRLGAQRVNRRPLAPVQHPVLDAACVCGQTHFAPQSVQLPDQVALAGAADGGVAGHIAHGVQVDGEEKGVQPQPGGGQGSLNAGVARTDDGHVAFVNKIGHAHASRGSSFAASFFSSLGSTKGLHTTSQRWMGVPRA